MDEAFSEQRLGSGWLADLAQDGNDVTYFDIWEGGREGKGKKSGTMTGVDGVLN